MMQTGEARNSVKANGVQNLSVPPGFVSRTAFILKRMVSGEDTQKPAHKKNVSDITPLSSHGLSSLEDNALEANLQIKHRAWIIHDQLDHHEKELDDQPNHENVEIASEGCLPKGLIWGCSACSNCLKVPAQWDLEGARSFKLEEAPVFQPTDEEFKDTLKYIESISQQVKPYGLCRIVPPPSWQPPCLFGESNVCEGFNFSTQVQRITDFRNCSKRKGLASRNVQESKRQRISKLDLDNESGNGDTVNFEVLGSPQAEQFQFQFGPHFTFESFKKNADYFKECYFQKRSKVVNPEEASHVTCHQQWEPSEEDIEGEYWRILEKPTAEIEVLRRANLDAESLRNRVLESLKTETSNSNGYQDSGWNLSNLSRLPGSLLSLENSDYLGDLAPKFQIGMCFSTLPWELAEHHLYTLCCLHLGAPKIWYGVPGHYFSRFQAAVKKHFPGIFVQSPELLHKLAMQVSPSTLKAEGIPVYRCIQRPNEFILFLPGAYHTGFDCGFNVSESVCCATLEWLPHGQSAIELYREKQMKQLICPDKLLMRAAHEAVKARWEYLLKGVKTPAIMRWKDACGKDSAIAKTFKVRVKAEIGQRKFLCTNSQARKMDKCFDVGARKECCTCNSILYLSAAFCPCNPNKYACLKHTKNLCACAWSEKVFVLRFNISELNLLVEATEGKFSAINRWVKENVGYALECDTANPSINVIPEDEPNTDKALERKSDTSFSSVDGTIVKKAHEKLVAETMARILRVSSIDGSKSMLFDTWISSAAVDSSHSSSDSDDERSFPPLPLKDKKPLAESHSATNGQATRSSELRRGNQETKSSGKSDVVMEVVDELVGNPVRQKQKYIRRPAEKLYKCSRRLGQRRVTGSARRGDGAMTDLGLRLDAAQPDDTHLSDPVDDSSDTSMSDADIDAADDDAFDDEALTFALERDYFEGIDPIEPPLGSTVEDLGRDDTPSSPVCEPVGPVPEVVAPPPHVADADPEGGAPEEAWMPGGPQSHSLLRTYPTHVAAVIWTHTKRLARDPFLSPVDPDPFRKILKMHTRCPYFSAIHQFRRQEPDSWWPLAQRSGITSLGSLEFRRMDPVLISAFVERWHPETSSFHFPWGEITITLHDVFHILEIPIDGTALVSDMSDVDICIAAAEMLGLDVLVASQMASSGSFSINTTLKNRCDLLCRAAQRNERHVASMYLLMLLGSTVFTDKSGQKVKAKYLSLLLDHDRIDRYAWGVGVLANLYRQLGMASRAEAQGLAGCPLLLRTWIWTYFHAFQGHASPDLEHIGDSRNAARDGREVPQGSDSDRLISLRRVMDAMLYSEVRWQPWGKLDFSDPRYAPSLYRGVIECLDVREPYMPDRCLRQFGYRQCIPQAPLEARKVVRRARLTSYVTEYADEHCLWDADPRPFIELHGLITSTFAWDCDDAYLDWIDHMSHPYLDFRSVRHDPHAVPPVPPPPSASTVTLVASEMTTYLARHEDTPSHLTDLMIRWIEYLMGDVTPSAPPIPHASQRFCDSVHEEGSGSGRQLDEE